MMESPDISPEAHARGPEGKWAVPGICLFLAVVVFLVFGQTGWHGFVNYDDDQYVYDNPQVVQGLTLHGIAWAFATSYSAYWHPLTWLSHMLDCQLWGLNAGGHHLTNVIIHAANAMLLFLVLRRMTGFSLAQRLRGGAVCHPSFGRGVGGLGGATQERVEHIFLAADDVGVCAVRGEVQSPKSKVPKLFYGLALLLFALGLMSKPMLVTLPFVLLLLDYWPLQRVSSFKFSVSSPGPAVKWRVAGLRLVVEKGSVFVAGRGVECGDLSGAKEFGFRNDTQAESIGGAAGQGAGQLCGLPA